MDVQSREARELGSYRFPDRYGRSLSPSVSYPGDAEDTIDQKDEKGVVRPTRSTRIRELRFAAKYKRLPTVKLEGVSWRDRLNYFTMTVPFIPMLA